MEPSAAAARETAIANEVAGESYTWLREALDAVAALGTSFHADRTSGGTPEAVFSAAKPALLRLAKFETMALITVDREGFEFTLAEVEPPELRAAVQREMDVQTEEGNFGWALYQDRPVIVPGHEIGRSVLLHVLSTPSRISGMFMASMAEETPFIPEMAQKVLSILLQNCAGVLESGALYSELEEHNRNLEQTIEQRTRELRRSEEAARAASKAKSDFLANMSHEIRTPINGVLGMTSLILETELNWEQQEYAETTARSAENLLVLINDILDFSKIEAGQLSLENVPMDLRITVEDVGELLTARAVEKEIELAVRYVPATSRYFIADPVRIRQIVTNLAGNAIKFTDDGHVLITVEPEVGSNGRDHMKISVEDTGIGIEPEHVARVFEKFEQADASTTRKYGGTGLGLSISRELSELMGGSIHATSRPGRGSTFWVSLPLEPDLDAELPQLAPVSSPATVLLVSPTAVLRETLREQLEHLGLTVAGISAITDALDSIRNSAATGTLPDLVLVDHAFGEGACADFQAGLSTDPATRGLPLVRLTAGHLSKQANQGGQGYTSDLAKPMLERRIAEVLRLLDPQGDQFEASGSVTGTEDALGADFKAHGHILLVEDDDINRKMAAHMLHKMGLDVTVAENGALAVEAYDDATFDLILMDCQMPEMDGYEATGAIRHLEGEGPRTPIVALTASALQGDREKCLAAGMDDYVTKPLTINQLRKAVADWIQQPDGVAPTESGGEITPGAASAPDPVGPDASIFDEEAALAQVMGSHELLDSLVGMFFEQWPERKATLEESLAVDMEVFARTAHSIKGSTLTLSVGRVSEVAAEIETCAKADDLGSMPELLEQLDAQVEMFRTIFEHRSWA